jgi:putative DeoR family transcriptional regulator (stage III sporulation protein D)
MLHFQKERCEILGDYLLEHGETVRGAAKHFSISKSTVHKDVTVRLRFVNPSMFGEVRALLSKNKAERHLRGGEATRMKYRG